MARRPTNWLKDVSAVLKHISLQLVKAESKKVLCHSVSLRVIRMQPGHLHALSLIKQRALGTDAKYTVCPHPRAPRREPLEQDHPAGCEMTYEPWYLLAVQPSQVCNPSSICKQTNIADNIYRSAVFQNTRCVWEMCERNVSPDVINSHLQPKPGGEAASDSRQWISWRCK